MVEPGIDKRFPLVNQDMSQRLLNAGKDVGMKIFIFKKRWGTPTFDVIKKMVREAARNHKVDSNKIHVSCARMPFGKLASVIGTAKRNKDQAARLKITLEGVLWDDE